MANYISDEKFDLILNLILEGKGIREISRKTGLSRNTVRKFWREFWSYGGEPIKRKGGYWDHKKNKKERKE